MAAAFWHPKKAFNGEAATGRLELPQPRVRDQCQRTRGALPNGACHPRRDRSKSSVVRQRRPVDQIDFCRAA